MAGQAAARFDELLAVLGIAGRLLRQLGAGQTGLPDEGGDGLNFIGLQAELRHLGGRAPLVGVPQPIRNPFLLDLEADFLEVWANLLDFLLEVVGLIIELLFLGVEIAGRDGQVRGVLIVPIGDVVVAGLVAELIQARDFQSWSAALS